MSLLREFLEGDCGAELTLFRVSGLDMYEKLHDEFGPAVFGARPSRDFGDDDDVVGALVFFAVPVVSVAFNDPDTPAKISAALWRHEIVFEWTNDVSATLFVPDCMAKDARELVNGLQIDEYRLFWPPTD